MIHQDMIIHNTKYLNRLHSPIRGVLFHNRYMQSSFSLFDDILVILSNDPNYIDLNIDAMHALSYNKIKSGMDKFHSPIFLSTTPPCPPISVST